MSVGVLTSLSLHYFPSASLEVWAEPQGDGTWVVKINDYRQGFAMRALGVVDDFGSLVRDPTKAPSYVTIEG